MSRPLVGRADGGAFERNEAQTPKRGVPEKSTPLVESGTGRLGDGNFDLLLDALELYFENQRGEGRNAARACFTVSQGVGDDEFVF